MDLTTQCPQCATIFKASLAQLQLRKGYIRCVHCSHIFDGYEAVVPATAIDAETPVTPVDTAPYQPLPAGHAAQQPAAPKAPPPQVLRQRAARKPAHVISDLSDDPPPSVVRARPDFSISGRNVTAPAPEPTLSLRTAEQLPEPAPHFVVHASTPRDHRRAEPVLGRSDQPTVSSDTAYDGPVVQRSEASGAAHPHVAPASPYVDRLAPIRRAAWMVLIAVGVLVLLFQLVLVSRLQIAEALPSLRPTLERLCETVGCSVPYSRRADHILVTHAALQQDSSSTDDDAQYVLQVTLRNTYDKPQEWPTLVLELTDAAGARIARRNLAAATYLPADVAEKPFPAAAEQAIELPLTLQGLKVNGYQLTTFFP